ncbi:hypothetical protein J6590_087609 [Homalodisca vitripennis]|nr:hypothetical protein J6590_087609 [Homalodisca vitripennis]
MHGAISIRVDMLVGGERLSLLALYCSPSSDNDLDLFINDLGFYSSNRPSDRIHWLIGDVNCCILQENQRVGADLAGAVPPVAECVVDDDMHRVDSVFQLETVSEQDIVKVVQDVRGGSAPGLDDLPVSSIKENIKVARSFYMQMTQPCCSRDPAGGKHMEWRSGGCALVN